MNLNSNRPTSVSRLIWDADLEPKNNYTLKGDLIGRLARYCGLTMDSASGVVSSTFPTFGLNCTSVGYSGGSGTFTSSITLGLSEFINSLRSPVLSSDGSNIYYPEVSGSLILDIPYSIQVYTRYYKTYDYYVTHAFTVTLEFYDKNGLKLDTVSTSGSCYSNEKYDGEILRTRYNGTISFPCYEDMASVRVTFSAYAERTSSYYVVPRLHFPGTNVYFSGV